MDESSPSSRQDWEEAARQGTALEKLTRATDEGLRLQPLYDPADWARPDAAGFPGVRPWTRGFTPLGALPRGWEVVCEHALVYPPANAGPIGRDLAGGADGISLRVGSTGADPPAPGAGLWLRDRDDLLLALGGARLEETSISLEPGAAFALVAQHLVAAWQERGVAPAAVRGCFGADPCGALADPHAPPLEALRAQLGELARESAQAWPAVRVARAAGEPWHEAGADAALELGLILASALDSLRVMTGAGLPLDRAARALELSPCLDADLYLSVARLRALRRCWGRALEALGLEPAAAAPRVTARTSGRMLSRRDPWTNSLRCTLAAIAAATGGADALIVLPFDQALGPPSDRARRLARTTQLVLREEARLHHPLDPWGGSYFMERLSEELARAAWARLQELEGLGGVEAALRSGWLAERIGQARGAREQRVARRRDALVGVSDWPLPGEPPPEGLAPEQPAHPLAPRRLAAPWEALWLRCAAHAALTGAPPRVALIGLGPLAEHLTRSTWIANLLAAAGIEAPAPDGDGAGDAEGAVAALRRSGARVAVLCGPDARYAALTASLAPALRAAGATHLLQAGAPGEQEAAWRAAGVDGFLSAGSDVLAACERLLGALGVA